MAALGGFIPIILGGLATMLMGNDEPKQQEAAPAPKVEPVTPMPVADDKAVQDAKRKSIAAITARQGRASTILSGNNDASGGGGGTLGV